MSPYKRSALKNLRSLIYFYICKTKISNPFVEKFRNIHVHIYIQNIHICIHMRTHANVRT